MSFELVNTLATLGTFVVIAATAIAAIVQLRHTRGSNQIAALSELRETMESREFAAASQFVRAELASKLRDAAFRYQIANRNARTDEYGALIAKMSLLGNVYEAMGLLVKTGLVEQALVMEMWSKNVLNDWERLAPYIAIRRRATGDGLYENFEYLAVLAQDWVAAHPKGTYPAGLPRLALKDEWLEADKKYGL